MRKPSEIDDPTKDPSKLDIFVSLPSFENGANQVAVIDVESTALRCQS